MKNLVAAILTALATGTCADPPPRPAPPEPQCFEFDPLRRAFFGDTHVHTALSFDVNLMDTRVTPDEAYRYAKGETISLFPFDEDGNPIGEASIDRPLDFAAISDHGELMGAAATLCHDTRATGYDTPYCATLRSEVPFLAQTDTAEGADFPLYCGPDGEDCIAAADDAWELTQDEAEFHHDRSTACSFTTFVAYEWTAKPMHRNVIFAGDEVPARPFSARDSRRPEDLWQYLETECLEAEGDCDVLAIPHNSNMSNHRTSSRTEPPFVPDTERLLAEFAADSHRMEPLIEIMQNKGSSECLPDMTVSDEECGFEVLPWAKSIHADPLGVLGLTGFVTPDPRTYVRTGLGEGLAIAEQTGINPFEYGIIASTDTHSGTPGQVAEDQAIGHSGNFFNMIRGPLTGPLNGVAFYSPGGLAGVWAEENSREALFRAMRRKETFGTSGPRIQPRFFGSWSYDADLVHDPYRIERAYADGVPMGRHLPEPPSPDARPTFFACAEQDTRLDNGEFVPLQSLEVIKGWLDEDGHRSERILIAGEDDSPASVDLDTCVPESNGHGSESLCSVWTDDDFDPTRRAWYYLRVLENPTCRWTTRQCSTRDIDCSERPNHLCCDPKLGLNRSHCEDVQCTEPEGLSPEELECCEPFVEASIRERAWTSPIWYAP